MSALKSIAMFLYYLVLELGATVLYKAIIAAYGKVRK